MNDSPSLALDRVLETALYVADLDEAERFYREVFGLQLVGRQPGRHVFFRCGQAMLLLFNPEHTSNESVSIGGRAIPKHGTRGAGHMAFAVEASALPAWRERLCQCAVPIEVEIDWPQGGRSLYVRDPAGNSVELATPSLWPQLKGTSIPSR